MQSDDLRGFITCLEQRGLLRRVRKEVDWRLEIGAIMHQLHQTAGPAALFERVKGSDGALLSGAVGTLERYALALDAPPDLRAIQAKITQAFLNPTPVKVVESAPCQEQIIAPDEIDLERYPTPHWHPLDGGRYIGTLGVVITKDPDTGKPNAGIYRQQIADRDKTCVLLGRDASVVFQKYQALGQPMPVATCFGLHPAVLTSVVLPVNFGVDELAVAGSLRGEPLSVVPAKTVDLMVPAQSEIVLEGFISPDPNDWLSEGPFGEYTGYYAGEPSRQPTIQLSAITQRSRPIMHGTYEGRAPNESDMLASTGMSASLKAKLISSGLSGIKDVWTRSRGFIAVVSLERQYYSGHACQVMDVTATMPWIKWTIVVDGDVNVFNWEDVEWALGVHVQPHRDVMVTDDRRRGMTLDPSIPPDVRPRPWNRSSKIGVDATTQFKGFPWSTPAAPDPDVLQRVLDHWPEYGFAEPKEPAHA